MTEQPVIVYPAKSITTMNPMAPAAQVVAIAGERIAAVGSREGVVDGLKLAGREYVIDETFAEAAMLPGLIEAHSHITSTGAFYQMSAYVGAYPRLGPNGMVQPCLSRDEVLAKLREVAPNVTGPLTAWGYDPVLLEGAPILTAADLDSVDATRPVAVVNMSGHIAYCNSVALRAAGYDDSTEKQGVVRDSDGHLTGELYELGAMLPLIDLIMKFDAGSLARGVTITADLAQQRGLTTISDLLTQSPNEVQAMSDYTHSDAARTRMTCYYSYLSLAAMGMDKALPFLAELCSANDNSFRVAGVKFVSDGSIQGFTADLLMPPYYNGAANGLFNFGADIAERMQPFHDAGYQIATHTNADGASDKMLDALAAVLDRSPRRDNRHRLEHVQMITYEQIQKMASYGISANVFAKHTKYWGDVHRTMTLGPDRAAQMNPVRSLIDAGVHTSLHSDSWVTPIDQLEAVVCATTRRTRSGFVLGPEEAITIEQALRAVTLDAAYLLREDHIKGSLEPGKLADVTILDREVRTAQDAEEAKPIATVLGGKVLPI